MRSLCRSRIWVGSNTKRKIILETSEVKLEWRSGKQFGAQSERRSRFYNQNCFKHCQKDMRKDLRKWISPNLIIPSRKTRANEDKWTEEKEGLLWSLPSSFQNESPLRRNGFLLSILDSLHAVPVISGPRFHPFHVKILSPLNGEFNEGENVSTLFFIMRENFNQRISFSK